MNINLLVVALYSALLATGGYLYGQLASAKKYEPQLATLRAALETVNQQGQAQIAKGKDTLNATTKQNDSNIAAIRTRYERMLRGAKGDHNTGSTAASAVGIDAASGEQSVVGCSAQFGEQACAAYLKYKESMKYCAEHGIEFEQSCILDANKVTQWQEWARRNQIPVAE